MNKLVLGLLTLLPGLGCVTLQPVGPLTTGSTPASPAPGVAATAPKDAASTPIIQSTPAPAPPALLVTPGEVTEANHADAARRLMEELEADRRSMEATPRPAEISVIRR